MKNKLVIFVIVIALLSCNDKKEGIKKLNNVMNNIKLATTTTDPELVESVILEIKEVENIYPEQQSLKESRYMLELRLKKYNDAIKTINSLLELSPDDVDNRVILGIIYEIIGSKDKSVEVLEKALDLINIKIEKMLKGNVTKKLGRDVNRVMILKLLERDTKMDYEKIKNDPDINKNPEILQLLILLENGPREAFINKYR